MNGPTGDVLLREWEACRSAFPSKAAWWRARYADVFTYPALLGRMWRARQKLAVADAPALYGHDFGRPLELAGDWCIFGDVHCPTVDVDFAHLMLAVAERHLRRPRHAICAGDLFNMDCFSDYADIIGLPCFKQEVAAAQHFLAELLSVFDQLVILPGNHDRRAAKKTGAALLMRDLVALVTTSPRVVVTEWGHVNVTTPAGVYRVCHGSEYSVNQLAVADLLAQKYACHVIGHHQHHLAKGMDRFKAHVVIDNGGLFDPSSLAYTLLDSSKKPRMAQGFTLLRGGFADVFGPYPYTNYDAWLPDARAARRVH